MEEMKQVIAMLVQSFVETEKGNRVTSNNMVGFMQQIFGALDGEITLKETQTQTPVKVRQEDVPGNFGLADNE